MGRKELNQNGGWKRHSTGTIIALKMKTGIDTGYSDQAIILPKAIINGTSTVFLLNIRVMSDE